MNKQTAVEWLIEQISEKQPNGLYVIDTLEDVKRVFEQAKQMEKEQMIEFAEFVASHPDKNRNYLGNMLHAKSKYDGAERTVDLLEQYYKETYGE